MATKDTNPKDALGVRKVSIHTIPFGPLLEVGNAMLEGGCKYGTHNYREAGCRYSVYLNSTVRHMIDWFEGQDIDPDSGVHHVVKAIAGLMVLRDSMLMGNDVDDRPIRYPGGLDMSQFNKTASDILDKYPERVAPFTQVRKDWDTAVETEAIVNAEPPHCDGHCHRDGNGLDLTTPKLDGARQSITTMPPLDLPDDNKVIAESEETEEDNGCRAITDPKRRLFCDHPSCFTKGVANNGRMSFRCPKHPPVKKEGESDE